MSSVINGFETLRQTARESIERAGGHAILVNEDFAAQAASSRNVCLDAVASCDFFVILVGERGGWRTPSGKLVVEEELAEARKRGIPIRVFVKRGPRDADADNLVRDLSDYVKGSFRVEFSDEAELRARIADALTPVLNSKVSEPMSTDLRSRLEAPFEYEQSPMLRIVLTPLRDEEVFEPKLLRSEDFIRQVYEIGHAPSVGLMDFGRAKDHKRTSDGLVIRQQDGWKRGEPQLLVRINVEEQGIITIEGNITGRSRNEREQDAFIGMSVLTGEIERFLTQAFAFVSGIFSAIDRFGRYEQLQYNVSLGHLGYGFVEESTPIGNSRAMNMYGNDSKPIIAHKMSRTYLRSDAQSIQSECERTSQRLLERSRVPQG